MSSPPSLATPTEDSAENTDLEVAMQLAAVADAVSMHHYLSDDLGVETKADDSPVTVADKGTERAIRDRLALLRPADDVWGEEFGDGGDGARRWIIDPIDGTKNYLRGVPVWSTLIGLEVAGKVEVGVVSAPALGRRWWAATGQGAWTQDVNGAVRRIQASGVGDISEASLSFSDEIGWPERGAHNGLRTLIDRCWRTRAYGDFLSHVLVAEGAVDIAAEPDLMPWDMAALIPIVRESGGSITDFSGGPALSGGCAVSTNSHLHDYVVGLLQSTPASE